MIVCVCHAISDKTLEAIALREGGDMRAVVRATNVCTDCGSCQKEVLNICKAAKRALPLWPAHHGTPVLA